MNETKDYIEEKNGIEDKIKKVFSELESLEGELANLLKEKDTQSKNLRFTQDKQYRQTLQEKIGKTKGKIYKTKEKIKTFKTNFISEINEIDERETKKWEENIDRTIDINSAQATDNYTDYISNY